MKLWMQTQISLVAGLLLVAAAFAQAPATKKGAAPSASPQPKFKAIWEPVPFGKDIRLYAIACLTPETCWAAGEKSTIIHTKDGGKTWQAQLGGDPEATEDSLTDIFFLKPRQGWVMSYRNKLMGTSDGSTWAELGTLLGTSQAMVFTSPQTGFYAENSNSTSQSTLQRTDNGGKAWKPVYQCGVDATIGGLARKLPCRLYESLFLSTTTGFLGAGALIDMATQVATFVKTGDGGQTWTASVIPDTKSYIQHLMLC